MKHELESKGKLVIELTRKHELDCKEKESLKKQIKDAQENEKNYQNKIAKLNSRIAELLKRKTLTIKSDDVKKVLSQPEIVQNETGNKVLEQEIKKLELERWSLEKKHENEKQNLRENLKDKEKKLVATIEQLSKSQVLIGKLEKQLRDARKKISTENNDNKTPVPESVPKSSKSIQTEIIKSVRFEEVCEGFLNILKF